MVCNRAVEAGEYNSMQEAITEVLLPIIREQSTYSDYAFGRVISEIAALSRSYPFLSSWRITNDTNRK